MLFINKPSLSFQYLSVQGLRIHYKDASVPSAQYHSITVMDASAESFVVGNLKKYTKYEFFLTPFFETIEGQPSNSKTALTYEDGNN